MGFMAVSLQKTRDFMGAALDFVLPPRCPVSEELVDRQGVLAPQVWRELRFIADPKCRKCGYPFDFEMENDALCMSCQTSDVDYDRARSALAYEGVTRDLILRFKHGDQTHVVSLFIPWLRQAGADILPETDLFVPVPLHRWRLLKRRYNQSALIAKALAKSTGVPLFLDALMRVKATVPQGYMNAGQRQRNVSGAFAVNPARQSQVAGKTVTIIDDVYTTGATVSQCARTLKLAGAARVNVLTVCRVVHSG